MKRTQDYQDAFAAGYAAGQRRAGTQHGRRAGHVDAQPDEKQPELSPGEDRHPAQRARSYSTSVIPAGRPAERRDVVTIKHDQARAELERLRSQSQRSPAWRSKPFVKPPIPEDIKEFVARRRAATPRKALCEQLRATIAPLRFPEHITRAGAVYAAALRDYEKGIRA